jgi:hypothetical protein
VIDDRGYLFREISLLKKKIKRDERTSQLLRSEITSLYDSFHEKLNQNANQTENVAKRKSSSNVDKVDNEIKLLPRKKSLIEIPGEKNLWRTSSTSSSMVREIPQYSRPSSTSNSGTRISKSEREFIDGHECEECRRYYRIMEQQGLITSADLECGLTETLRRCSRHKSHWSPPLTPDGFWDLTVHTPDEWRKDSSKSNWRKHV